MGNLAEAGHQGLGRLAAGAGAELGLGAAQVAVDGLRRDAEPDSDFLAAIAFDDEAQTIPFTVCEELQLLFRPGGVECFPHMSSVSRR
jgi:hypothetical protein